MMLCWFSPKGIRRWFWVPRYGASSSQSWIWVLCPASVLSVWLSWETTWKKWKEETAWKNGQLGRVWDVLPPSRSLPPDQAVVSAVRWCSCQAEDALLVYHHLQFYSLLLWPFGVSISYSQMCLVILPYSPAIPLFKHHSNRSYGSTRETWLPFLFTAHDLDRVR